MRSNEAEKRNPIAPSDANPKLMKGGTEMSTPYHTQCSVRSIYSQTYSPAIACGLEVLLQHKIEDFYELRVKNVGDHMFSGVIHLEMVFRGENPRFFMPAFLYGRNRGEVPPYRNQNGDYLPFPRLSADNSLDCTADWWMVRGDRLSHPVSMAVWERPIL